MDTGETVAVKKVLQVALHPEDVLPLAIGSDSSGVTDRAGLRQDKRFKNRELHIMKQLRHVNVVELKSCFYSNGDKPDEVTSLLLCGVA